MSDLKPVDEASAPVASSATSSVSGAAGAADAAEADGAARAGAGGDAVAAPSAAPAALPFEAVCWHCKGAGEREGKKGKLFQCKVCKGEKVLRRTRRRKRPRQDERAGAVTTTKRRAGTPAEVYAALKAGRAPDDWTPPGPLPARVGEPLPDEDLCRFVGSWKIFQRFDKHRYSTDDVVTAWCAKKELERCKHSPPTVLDMGCGIGSVLMMNAWLFPSAKCVGIEAQERRGDAARRSVLYNGVDDRVRVLIGDIRDQSMLPDGTKFDLVTGTPPYFPVAQGGVPPEQETAACLFEYRGGVEDYCAAAARWLSPNGRFVVCDTSLAKARVRDGATLAGLQVLRSVDVVGKIGKPPLFSVFIMKPDEKCRAKPGAADHAATVSASDQPKVEEVLVVRDADGNHTPEYAVVMEDMGMLPSRAVYEARAAAAEASEPGAGPEPDVADVGAQALPVTGDTAEAEEAPAEPVAAGDPGTAAAAAEDEANA